MICSLSRPWPARWLSALCGQQDQRRQMAQNENGEETQKSEHGRRRVIVSSTIVLSLSEADGGRCGREVFGQKVPAAPARTLYDSFSPPRAAPATFHTYNILGNVTSNSRPSTQSTVSKTPLPRGMPPVPPVPPGARGRAFVATHTTRKPTPCGVGYVVNDEARASLT